MSGGEIIGDLIARKSAEFELSGGNVGDDVRLADQTRFKMIAGRVGGGLVARDSADALISGGSILGDVTAEDTSRIRFIGTDLAIRGDRLGGKLMDGSRIRGEITKDDKASIELFEGLPDRTVISGLLPDKNYAISDGTGRDTVVDFLPGADVTGELAIFEDGRANFFGGSFTGQIEPEDNSTLAFYGSDHRFTFTDDGTVARVTGKDINGNAVEYDMTNASRDVRFYTTITEDTDLDRRQSFSIIAVLDGESGPTTVTASADTFLGQVEVRNSSTFNSKGFVQGSYETLSLWNEGTLNLSEGNVLSYRSEAIKANDSSRVNISGGGVNSTFRDGVRVWDVSSLTMSGGTIEAADDGIDVDHSASVYMSGGTVSGGDDGIKAKETANLVIEGGEIQGADDGVSLANDSQALIFGTAAKLDGGVNGLLAIENSFAEIRAGTFSGDTSSVRSQDASVVHIFGGEFENRILADGGDVLIVGANLSVDDSGTVTGELLDQSSVEWKTETLGDGSVRIINTFPGDSNLDGEFNSTDLVEVFNASEYEDNLPLNSTWSDGDWNGDGDFDTSDLVFAFNVGGYEQGPRPQVAGVPEPSNSGLLLVWILALAFTRRRVRR